MGKQVPGDGIAGEGVVVAQRGMPLSENLLVGGHEGEATGIFVEIGHTRQLQRE